MAPPVTSSSVRQSSRHVAPEAPVNRFRKAGAEFLIESHTRGVQMHPQLAAVQGSFVAAWTDDILPACEVGGSDVRAKLFSVSGNPIRGEFLVNRETIAYQRDPKVAGFPNGGFVVVWQDFSGRGGDDCCGGIKAKLFGADGRVVHDELTVNVDTYGTQFNATVAALADGAFVVAWQGYKGVGKDAVRGGVRARLFKPSGAPAGDEFLLSACPEGRQDSPLVAGLADGNFVAVWTDLSAKSTQGSGGVIKAKIFGPNGAMVRDEFLVSPPTAKSQAATAVASLRDGGFVIAWIDRAITQNKSEVSIKLRVFDSNGEPSGDEFSMGPGTLNDQPGPVLAPLLDGGFVLVWSGSIALGDDAGRSVVRAAVFEPNGTLIGRDFLISPETTASQRSPTVAGLSDGGVAVAWEHAAADANGAVSVRAQIFSPAASSAAVGAHPSA